MPAAVPRQPRIRSPTGPGLRHRQSQNGRENVDCSLRTRLFESILQRQQPIGCRQKRTHHGTDRIRR